MKKLESHLKSTRILSWAFNTWNNEITWKHWKSILKILEIPHLEITEVLLVHCNIVNKDYQQDSKDLYTFVANEPLGNLL